MQEIAGIITKKAVALIATALENPSKKRVHLYYPLNLL